MISSSPDRGSFTKEIYTKKVKDGTTTPEYADQMLDFLENRNKAKLEQEQDPEWQKENLEYDLRTCDWMLDKVRNDDAYAQNLYAALCNNEFIKNDVWPVLTDKRWHCSWRYAGGILADMRQQGDYIDWYCSGIREEHNIDDDQFQQMSKEAQELYIIRKKYVGEGHVTDEIQTDLKTLGWLLVDEYQD